MDREIYPPNGDTPLLAWWRGLYDRVYVALNPFVRLPAGADEDRTDRFADLCKQQGEAVSWEQVHRAVAPEEAQQGVYEAIWYSTVGLRDYVRPQLREKLWAYMEREQNLYYPEQDTMPPVMEPAIGRFLAAFGASSVIAWDEFRDYSSMLPLSAFDRQRPAIFLSKALTYPGVSGLFLEEPGVLVTWQFDGVEALIAMTDRALTLTRPERYFEGWYAGEGVRWDVFGADSFASRSSPYFPLPHST